MSRGRSWAGMGAGASKLDASTILSLAAAPAFAAMALFTGLRPESMQGMLCSAQSVSILDGMLPMYLLMCVVHAGPWLRWLREQVASAVSRWSGFPDLHKVQSSRACCSQLSISDNCHSRASKSLSGKTDSLAL